MKVLLHGQETVFSLILGPDKDWGLRGFCLFIFSDFLFDYRQKNPLKYYFLSITLEKVV